MNSTPPGDKTPNGAARRNGSADIPLAVVGCDFRVASSHWRSRLVLSDEEACQVARRLKRNEAADGFFDLNTCNRNEWIVSCTQTRWAAELLRSQMIQRAGKQAQAWFKPYVYTGVEAAEHIFRVAIGQESLVVGERQIASQLYQAMEAARKRQTSSRILNGLGTVAGRLVRIALRRGCIENAAVGVHSLAVSYLEHRVGKDRAVRLGVIGLGRIGRRVLGLLEDRRRQTVCCNRTVEPVSSQRVSSLEDLEGMLAQVDAAIVCTGALQPLVRAEHLHKRPADRPLLILDIGIPEQVEHDGLPQHVEVAGLDDLTTFYHQHHRPRTWEASRPDEAAELVQRAVGEFRAFCNEQAFAGILDTVQRHHRLLVGEEIPRLIHNRLGYLPEKDRARLEGDLRNIVLEYTSEVFRTIKEASMRDPEDRACQDES